MSLPPRLRRHRASLVALVAAAAIAVYVIAAPARLAARCVAPITR